MAKTNKMHEREIARAIVSAQIASDAGKGIFDLALKNSRARSALHHAYGIKPDMIIRAIQLISSQSRGMFNFFVDYTLDQNGFPSVLVYFDFKIFGERYQVSFHTPEDLADDLIPLAGKGRPTRWFQAESPAKL